MKNLLDVQMSASSSLMTHLSAKGAYESVQKGVKSSWLHSAATQLRVSGVPSLNL